MARINSLLIRCINCETEFKSLDIRRKFCSQSCAASYNNRVKPKRTAKPRPVKKSTIQKWLDGEFDGTTKAGLSSPVRLYLLEQAGYKCQSPTCCIVGGWSGINPVSKKTALTVDHINGMCYDNRRENLIVLCPNCHSLTPTYGALNKGSGRPNRYSTNPR